MKEFNFLRREIQKYIDSSNEKAPMKILSILQMEQEIDWWDESMEEAKASIEKG